MGRTAASVSQWLRDNPGVALDVFKNVQPVGDWKAGQSGRRRMVGNKSVLCPIDTLVRRNHLGHAVATIAPSMGRENFPGMEFCAWMTYPLRAPHALYRPTVPECMVAADTELQENPKCLLVNPRTSP